MGVPIILCIAIYLKISQELLIKAIYKKNETVLIFAE